MNELHQAAKIGDIKTVEKLLQENHDPMEKDIHGRTPLHVAAKHGHANTATALLRYGADPNARIGRQQTALHITVEGKHLAVVEALLHDRRTNRDSQNLDGWTPLHLAAATGETEIAECLIKHEAEIDIPDYRGRTPLHRAAKYGHTAIATLLLTHHADANQKDRRKRTPLHRAISSGHAEMVILLLNHGADLMIHDERGATLLHLAISIGDEIPDVITALMSQHINLIIRDDSGNTPLRYAAESNQLNTIEKLLRSFAGIGADLRKFSVSAVQHILNFASEKKLLLIGAQLPKNTLIPEGMILTLSDFFIQHTHLDFTVLHQKAVKLCASYSAKPENTPNAQYDKLLCFKHSLEVRLSLQCLAAATIAQNARIKQSAYANPGITNPARTLIDFYETGRLTKDMFRSEQPQPEIKSREIETVVDAFRP